MSSWSSLDALIEAHGQRRLWDDLQRAIAAERRTQDERAEASARRRLLEEDAYRDSLDVRKRELNARVSAVMEAEDFMAWDERYVLLLWAQGRHEWRKIAERPSVLELPVQFPLPGLETLRDLPVRLEVPVHVFWRRTFVVPDALAGARKMVAYVEEDA